MSEALIDTELERLVVLHESVPAGWQVIVPGSDGLGCLEHPGRSLRVIHSMAREGDGNVWLHVSVSRRDRSLPTWAQLREVKDLFIGEGRTAIQVLPPRERHINRAEVLHLWCCLTADIVPDFARGGDSI